jgi:type IV pilus assembly protein PilW
MKGRTFKIGTVAGSRMAGFSLVEIMVALLISLFILGGAISILIQNQQNYRHNDDFGRLQENARFALDMITGDLRMAGYIGCVRHDTDRVRSKLLNIDAGSLLDPTFLIDGYEEDGGVWAAQGNQDLFDVILPGTDAITLRRLRNRGVPITASMVQADEVLNVSTAPVAAGEIAAIYNCQRTDIFQAVAVVGDTISHAGGANPGNAGNALSLAYDQNAAYVADPAADPDGDSSKTFVAGFDAVRYFLADNNGQPALWREFHNGAAGVDQQPLVDGIEQMQFLYGEDLDLDGAPDSYVSADAVGNWNQVVSVRVTLLVRTIDEYGDETDTRKYDIYSTPDSDGDDFEAPGDRRSRKLVSATVLLRNLQTKVGTGT